MIQTTHISPRAVTHENFDRGKEVVLKNRYYNLWTEQLSRDRSIKCSFCFEYESCDINHLLEKNRFFTKTALNISYWRPFFSSTHHKDRWEVYQYSIQTGPRKKQRKGKIIVIKGHFDCRGVVDFEFLPKGRQ